jgi:hypothetical protein
MATSVTRHAITWTFSEDHVTGTFANGDPWVVENTPGGKVIITDIDPPSEVSVFKTAEVAISQASPAVVSWPAHDVYADQVVSFATTGDLPAPLVAGMLYQIASSGWGANSFRLVPLGGGAAIITTTPGSGTHTITVWRYTSGSMINPTAGNTALQGFDGQLNGGGGYRVALNAGRPGNEDLDASHPLEVPAGSSLISTISAATAYTRPALTDAAVLTILAEAPPAGSFRPPYCGSDKTINWNVSDLDYGAMRSLTPAVGAPSLATVEGYFERVWIEIHTDNNGRYYHPSNHQPDYGGNMAYQISEALLLLQTSLTDEEKETLLIRIVQYGIDIYGALESGGEWSANGGLNLGRKMPMLLAGLVLGDATITARANHANYPKFQEDLQSFVVSESDVGRTVTAPRETYTEGHVGLPEWGEKHASDPQRDDSRWGALYRNYNYSSLIGHILAAHLMPGARAAWNNEVIFDYYDRVIEETTDGEFPPFSINMWHAYRDLDEGGGESPPSAPSITATAVGPFTVEIEWSDVGDGNGYRIEMSLDESVWTLVATLPADTVAWTHRGRAPGVTYYYRAVAYNAAGDSTYGTDNATTPAAPPVRTGRLTP